jgi:hypothetical protein
VFVEMPTVSRHVVDKSRRHSAELAREWWLFAHTGSRFHSSDFQQKGWKAPILFDWPHHDRAIEKANSFSPLYWTKVQLEFVSYEWLNL